MNAHAHAQGIFRHAVSGRHRGLPGGLQRAADPRQAGDGGDGFEHSGCGHDPVQRLHANGGRTRRHDSVARPGSRPGRSHRAATAAIQQPHERGNRPRHPDGHGKRAALDRLGDTWPRSRATAPPRVEPRPSTRKAARSRAATSPRRTITSPPGKSSSSQATSWWRDRRSCTSPTFPSCGCRSSSRTCDPAGEAGSSHRAWASVS